MTNVDKTDRSERTKSGKHTRNVMYANLDILNKRQAPRASLQRGLCVIFRMWMKCSTFTWYYDFHMAL